MYAELGWSMFPAIERVYVNDRARRDLGWEPRHDFRSALDRLAADEDWRSQLARSVGAKGYHASSPAYAPAGNVTALAPRRV